MAVNVLIRIYFLHTAVVLLTTFNIYILNRLLSPFFQLLQATKKKNSEICPSSQVSAAEMSSASDEKLRPLKQYIEQHNSVVRKSADPSLRGIPWHLPYNWGKSTEKTSVRVAGECQLAWWKQNIQNRTYITIKIHKQNNNNTYLTELKKSIQNTQPYKGCW